MLTVYRDASVRRNGCLDAGEVAVHGDQLVADGQMAALEEVLHLHPVLGLRLRVDNLAGMTGWNRPHLQEGVDQACRALVDAVLVPAVYLLDERTVQLHEARIQRVSLLEAFETPVDTPFIVEHIAGARPELRQRVRFGRRGDTEHLRQTLPLTPLFFDCVFADDEPLLDEPLSRRLRLLHAVAPPAPSQAASAGEREADPELEALAGSIDWLAAADNYVELRIGGRVTMRRMTMRQAERSLAGRGFVRIHRRYLVNRNRIVEVRGNGDKSVRLSCGVELPVGGRYAANLPSTS